MDPFSSRSREQRLVRVRLHLWKVRVALLTAWLAAWLCLLGPVPAIVALLTAKHVLVALLFVRHDETDSDV